MALPLTLGYAVARMQSRYRAGEPFDLEAFLDSKAVLLGTAVCLMVAGLLFSQSRSGLLGGFAALLYFAWRSRRRLTTKRVVSGIVVLGIILGVAATFADMGALSTRLQSSVSEGLAGRMSIWRQTGPVVRDFWLVGSGAGTYQSVMVLYQTMSRLFYISHADNELLQILAEGGLMLGLPVALTIAAGAQLIAKRLREDRTAIFWLRVGAAAGILALVTQNMVEMTLRVPANAVLFAILAAIALHDGGT
jgi:O-antigen ligase